MVRVRIGVGLGLGLELGQGLGQFQGYFFRIQGHFQGRVRVMVRVIGQGTVQDQSQGRVYGSFMFKFFGFRVTQGRVSVIPWLGFRLGLGSGVRVGFMVIVRIRVRVGFRAVLGLNVQGFMSFLGQGQSQGRHNRRGQGMQCRLHIKPWEGQTMHFALPQFYFLRRRQWGGQNFIT